MNQFRTTLRVSSAGKVVAKFYGQGDWSPVYLNEPTGLAGYSRLLVNLKVFGRLQVIEARVLSSKFPDLGGDNEWQEQLFQISLPDTGEIEVHC